MPQSGEPSQPQPSAEESFLDLLIETLEGVDESVRGQFLKQFFHNIAQIDLTEAQSNEYWHRILERRGELTEGTGKRISMKTAMVDVLSSTNFLRVPILVEYDDFKKLQINAATDALTGLYNRRLFDEYCDKELNRAKRYGQYLAVVIIDLHKLKEVNDRHGHLQGDHVLQLAASTLRKTLRAADFAFRIGGDEFALLLPQTDPEQANILCTRLRARYENEVKPFKLNVGLTLDFGVAVHPQDGDQKSVLMGLADERLYALKTSGRPATRVIPLEPQPIREVPPTKREDVPAYEVAPPQPLRVTAPPIPPPATSAVPRPVTYGEKRKWERVSLAGTKANAILTEAGQKSATVVDLSYGGVALLLERPEEIPGQFNAVLHVPILPPVRVSLKIAYTQRLEGGRTRIGCAFVS
ncbi:MAG: GGDEF domain-containing protein [Candidatus Acidiferrales bacterium]